MKKVNEVKVSPEHKKQFLKDALVILDNMEKANLVDKDADFKTVNNTLRMVFSKIAGGKDSYNNRLFHKILPKKLNTDLYDNGDGNTYDSVWMSQNDAQRDTILKKAIKAKLNISEADVDEVAMANTKYSKAHNKAKALTKKANSSMKLDHIVDAIKAHKEALKLSTSSTNKAAHSGHIRDLSKKIIIADCKNSDENKFEVQEPLINEADVDENRALDNAIANRDANRANSKSEFKEFQSLYFDMHTAIRKVSKNNKLKGYAGEVTHAVCDLLYFVEQDRLAIGEVFNALKRLRKKARDH